jgi:hypothetical protein
MTEVLPKRLACVTAVIFILVPGAWRLAAGGTLAWGQDVLTERYNNGRTGAITQRMSSDAFRNWGKLGELPVDGRVYAQPLFAGGLQMSRGGPLRNVVFIATEHNTVYAFDADSLARIWMNPLGPNDRTHMGHPGCDGISVDGIGIEATPVIDREAMRIFVSYRKNPQGLADTARQYLVALDLRDGSPVAGPVEVTGPADFVPRWQRSRASLLLQNGAVHVAFASRCEEGEKPYYGFIFAFDQKTLNQLGVFETTKSGLFQGADNGIVGAGIWQASSGLAGDGSDLYFITGNRRVWDPADSPNLGDSFVRLRSQPTGRSPAWNFSVVDWFSPYRKVWLDEIDLDLGSAGPILIPGNKYLLGGGKQGWMYLLDRNNMGKLDAAKKWTLAEANNLKSDATEDQFPEDMTADKVVQKFQVGFQQYIPNNPSYLGPPGSPVATETQLGNQLDVFNVGRDGAVYVSWQIGNGDWSDGIKGRPYPARITPSLTNPGAFVAAAHQGANQLDAFVAGKDGAVYVTWVVGVGRWTDGASGNQGPVRITPAGVMPAGGCLATAAQTSNQLDVFYIGNDGAVYVTWVVGGGHWSDGTAGNPPPARITPANFAVPGACVTANHQTPNQLDVFAINKNDRAVWVTWVVGTGIWTDGMGNHGSPARITPVQAADPRATLASAQQTANQLDVFYPGLDGAVHVTWVVGVGHWSDGTPGNPPPARITPPNVTSPTSGVSTAHQTPNQLDVFYLQTGAGPTGALMVTWVVGVGHWSDGTPGNPFPAPTTPNSFVVSPGQSATSNAVLGELQVLFVGAGGALFSTHVTGVGHWTDGRDNNPLPQELCRALWMHHWPDWPQYPHVHGSPVFAQFPDGSARMFIWPEKDHLKSFAWNGSGFDLQSKMLGVGRNGKLLVGPDGMPGGMLALAVDSTAPHGGIVFASQTLTPETDGPGMLRAFDAVTLREIWNNGGEFYQFSKFVPPTVANNRVYLPTCSQKILVYGPH